MRDEDENQTGFVLWFTGLSASGKTTIAARVHEELRARGLKIEHLDGDNVRGNLTRDLGFSREQRNENIRRVGYVTKLLAKHGIGVIASFISPYYEQREPLKKEVINFIEVFVDAPLEVCEQRDPKGLYKRARSGEIRNFTGLDDPYEKPENPDIHLKTAECDIETCVGLIIKYLEKNILLS
ncbi:MAG: adenylyl-sulfate kinase [Planctomycetes bacterium]|jgi:adenylylsulfate kinase|nr:adenylyl-sulfate kinase [Planctomycetota bacterium]